MEAPKKRILQPFKGLDDVEFGTPMSDVKRRIGVDTSTLRNKHLKEEAVTDDKIVYVFENGILVTIELLHQDGIYYNDMDIFATQDLDALLQGHEVESKRNVMHIKTLGLLLFDFKLKNRTKRVLYFYSKAMLPEFDTFLDVV